MQKRPCRRCRKILGAPDIDHDFRVHGTLDPVDENIKLLVGGVTYWCQNFTCRNCGLNLERREQDVPGGKVHWAAIR